MESLDRTIALALAKDSSLSLSDFAAQLDVPSSTLHQRVKKLEARGVITGYRAEIDKSQVGLKISALVSLTPIDPAAPDDIVEKISKIAEIESCWSVAGVESYIVKVAVAEPEALEELLARIRAAANVSTKTSVILSTAFESRPPAIPEESSE
jgi:Lrp/AsnC family leucine-responsive transcriptional regulator|uniref:HTH-type transcriptional regulator LrpC n=1 Tax=uncultured Micrococcales bacterium TaxID=1920814 RepID=A0A871YDP4_9MICO|nr:HTH-type transcriptional regulator LrpC [uncultured Micrococcales bacterium]QOV09038.1 HTH-type transcriptional regulator LrpC [uncultured Micrococcales bacterium]